MEFNEFREKVKEALPDFLTDDLRNAEIKDTAVNKLQGESYSGVSVTPEGSRVGVSINLEDAFLERSIFWKATEMITPVRMLMCHKVTHRNLIDSTPLFRNSQIKI